jgi:hypothetical protein
MQKPAEIDIVRRAYELWEQAGEPDGRDQEFYHQAEQELQQAEEQPSRTRPQLEAVTQDGKVVDSHGFVLDPEDE